MKIGVNALHTLEQRSGSGEYTASLLEALLKITKDEEFVTYANMFNVHNFPAARNNHTLAIWGSRSRRKEIRLLYEYLFLTRQIQKDHLDVFWGPTNFLPLKKVCPYIATVHDMSFFIDPLRVNLPRRLYWHTFIRRSVEIADHIITVSNNSKNDIVTILSCPPEKVTVIYNAAHPRYRPIRDSALLEEFRRKEGLPDHFILYVGNLEPGKNLARLVQAYGRVKKEGFGQYKLILAGAKRWLYSDIYQTAQRLGIERDVISVGYVPSGNLPYYYNLCSVFAFPSLNEGFGLPPLEALACGTPVVCSNTSSLPEVVGKAALTFDPTSVDDIAHALKRLLSDEDLRARYSIQGIDQARRFSWKESAQRTIEVIRGVIE